MCDLSSTGAIVPCKTGDEWILDSMCWQAWTGRGVWHCRSQMACRSTGMGSGMPPWRPNAAQKEPAMVASNNNRVRGGRPGGFIPSHSNP